MARRVTIDSPHRVAAAAAAAAAVAASNDPSPSSSSSSLSAFSSAPSSHSPAPSPSSFPSPYPSPSPYPPAPAPPSGNVRVICRFRPRKDSEANHDSREDPFVLDEQRGKINVKTDYDAREFTFDSVIGPSASQEDVYRPVMETVAGVIDGINGTILAYGQTSSGKTFTMEGPSIFDDRMQGIIPRLITRLFELITEADINTAFTVKVSYFEIYCEKIRDLLDPTNVNLKTREDKDEGVVVQGVSELYVACKDDIMEILEAGKRNRASAPTLMNAESSRSHSILSVCVTQRNEITQRVRRGKLVLVDLAGSEKVSKTGAAGVRLEEAKNINRSLTTLGMVITALTDESATRQHVPYRDSKLTRVLQESLGGNSRTCLIICCAPESRHTPETISTLRFGERAKRITNRIKVNEDLGVVEVKAMLAKANAEIQRLRALLAARGITRADLERVTIHMDPETSPEDRSPHGDDVSESEVVSLRHKLAEALSELEVEREKVLWEQNGRLQAIAEVQALNLAVSTLEKKLIEARTSAEKEFPGSGKVRSWRKPQIVAGEPLPQPSDRFRTMSKRLLTVVTGDEVASPTRSSRSSSRADCDERASDSIVAPVSFVSSPAIMGQVLNADSFQQELSTVTVSTGAENIFAGDKLIGTQSTSLGSDMATTTDTLMDTEPRPARSSSGGSSLTQELASNVSALLPPRTQTNTIQLDVNTYRDIQTKYQELERLFEDEVTDMEQQLNISEQDAREARELVRGLEKQIHDMQQHHDATISMLMSKVTREQESKARLFDRIDFLESVLPEERGKDSQINNDTIENKSFLDRLIGSSRTQAQKIQKLEDELSRQVELLNNLREDLEAQKEAHEVVLATKESVMQSLLHQNLKLQNEKDAMVREHADKDRRIEELQSALRSESVSISEGTGRGWSTRQERYHNRARTLLDPILQLMNTDGTSSSGTTEKNHTPRHPSYSELPLQSPVRELAIRGSGGASDAHMHAAPIIPLIRGSSMRLQL